MLKRMFMSSALAYSNVFSIQFPGTDEYIDMGDIADFERTVPFSVSCWFKTSATGGSIISRRDGSPAFRGWELNNISGQVEFNLSNNVVLNNRIRMRTTAATFADNTWYNVVMTYDGSSAGTTGVKIYIDGVSEALTPVVDNLSATISIATNCNVGARNNGDNLWLGFLDEPAIYTKQLSQAEVTTIFKKKTPRNLAVLPSATDLLTWLKFTQQDKNNLPTIIDHSGNGNNATVVNVLTTDFSNDTP